MQTILAEILAALLAFAGAGGTHADMPDRPVIVQSAPSNPVTPLSEIEDESADAPKQSHLEIKGTITNLGVNSVTVNGRTITVDSKTRVEGTLSVGAIVQIEGTSLGATTTATEIEVQGMFKQEDSKSGSGIKSNDKSKSKSSNAIKSEDKSKDKSPGVLKIEDQPKDTKDDKSIDKSKSAPIITITGKKDEEKDVKDAHEKNDNDAHEKEDSGSHDQGDKD
jgi:uncharacterized protein DUF5666